MANDKLAVDPVTDLKVPHNGIWGRREFVKGVAALAGSAALLGYDLKPVFRRTAAGDHQNASGTDSSDLSGTAVSGRRALAP